MRAILEFNLPEDGEEFEVAGRGADLYLTLFDLDNCLRSWLKYGHKFKDADEALQAARDALYQEMNRHGVSLDMMS